MIDILYLNFRQSFDAVRILYYHAVWFSIILFRWLVHLFYAVYYLSILSYPAIVAFTIYV